METQRITNSNITPLDLLALIKANLKSIFLIMLVFILSAFIFNKTIPKRYQSSANFFLVFDNPGSAISGYLGLLGGRSGTSNLKDYIVAIIESNSLKNRLTPLIRDTFYPDATIQEVKEKVKYYKYLRISQNALNMHSLSFEHSNPHLSLFVIENTLLLIDEFNDELALTSTKDYLKIIDGPVLAEGPVFPKKKLNIFVGVLLGLMSNGLYLSYLVYRRITAKA